MCRPELHIERQPDLHGAPTLVFCEESLAVEGSRVDRVAAAVCLLLRHAVQILHVCWTRVRAAGRFGGEYFVLLGGLKPEYSAHLVEHQPMHSTVLAGWVEAADCWDLAEDRLEYSVAFATGQPAHSRRQVAELDFGFTAT